MSLFGGSPGISPKQSWKSLKTRCSSMLGILSLVSSSLWVVELYNPILKLFFIWMDEISLTTTGLGIP
jgi:hypothetical protein